MFKNKKQEFLVEIYQTHAERTTKISSKMENETYRFIALIEKHPQLYNKKHKDFLRQDIRNMIWENICKEMNWDGK